MTIDRRTLFTEAWKSARRMRGQYRTLRTAFAAALRRVWSLVKAMVAEEARRPVLPTRPIVSTWEAGNAHRAAAGAAHRARLGSYVLHCW